MALEKKKTTIEQISGDVKEVVASLGEFKQDMNSLPKGKIMLFRVVDIFEFSFIDIFFCFSFCLKILIAFNLFVYIILKLKFSII